MVEHKNLLGKMLLIYLPLIRVPLNRWGSDLGAYTISLISRLTVIKNTALTKLNILNYIRLNVKLIEKIKISESR